MKKEKQRLIIAEVHKGATHAFNGQLLFTCDSTLVPNYPEDLNAMHEAEKVLKGELQIRRYFMELWRLVNPKYGCEIGEGYRLFPQRWEHLTPLVNATAAQRAEAFIKTIEKRVADDFPSGRRE